MCLGGSAGATEIYADVLRHLPSDIDMTFVVVPHRGLDKPFALVQVLARATSMITREIEHGMLLRPNCVFVLPPGFHLSLSNSRFVLTEAHGRSGWPVTLSLFLSSLAESVGPRAIAVILSGLGNDGSSALAALRAPGGQIFAQGNARWEDMPNNAIATGNVDFVLSPAKIAEALAALSLKSQASF